MDIKFGKSHLFNSFSAEDYFIFEIDFLGITDNLKPLIEYNLSPDFDFKIIPHLFKVRQTHAIRVCYFVHDTKKTVNLEDNVFSWRIFIDKINQKDIGKPVPEGVFDPISEKEENSDETKIEDMESSNEKTYFKSWKLNNSRAYELIKKTPIEEFRIEFMKEFMNFIYMENRLKQHTLNICSNPTKTPSNIIRQRLGLSCELHNEFLKYNNLENMNLSKEYLREYFMDTRLLTILGFVGIIPKQYQIDDTIFNKIDQNNTEKSCIYLLCHFRIGKQKDLDDLSPEIDAIIIDIIKSDSEIKRIILESFKINQEMIEEKVFLKKILMQKKNNSTNIGVMIMISYLSQSLDNLDINKITHIFQKHVLDERQSKWNIRVRDIETIPINFQIN